MGRGKFGSLFIPMLFGLIGLYVALFVYYIWATVITVPYLDLLQYILRYDQYWRAGDWWHYLWLPQNEHRPIWSLLLVLADIGWYRGSTLPFILFDSACFLLTVGGLIWEIWLADLAIELRAAVVASVILLLAGSYAAIYCSLPIEGIYVHTTGLFVLALVLFDGVGEEGPVTTIRRAAAIVVAVFAAFGINSGLLAPPMLLWVAWAGGLAGVWLITIGLTAVILFAVFLPGLLNGQVAHPFDLAVLPKIADYFIRLLGLPWSHVESIVWIGRLVGCIVFSASIITLLRCSIRSRSIGRLERVGLALLMFSLLTTIMAAVGRWDVMPDRPMPIRYSVFAALVEAGLLLANTPWLNRLWQKGYQRPFQWATLGAAIVLQVQQVIAGQAAVAVTIQYKDSYRQFVAGQWTAVSPRTVFPFSNAEKERVLEVMRDLGIYQN